MLKCSIWLIKCLNNKDNLKVFYKYDIIFKQPFNVRVAGLILALTWLFTSSVMGQENSINHKEKPFTIIIFPDTQVYTKDDPSWVPGARGIFPVPQPVAKKRIPRSRASMARVYIPA